MKRVCIAAVLGATLLALPLSATGVLAQSTLDSSEYIQDDDGCWFTEGPTCLAHESWWDVSTFLSAYRNDCGRRILVKVCHEARDVPWKDDVEWRALANSQCEGFRLEAGQVDYLQTPPGFEPTGRAEFRWIGSIIAENDGLCADKPGVNDWWPDW